MIKLIIFDLDGVLIDSRDLHYHALNKALEYVDQKYIISRQEHLSTYDGLSTNKKLNLLSENMGLPIDKHDFVWNKKQEATYDIIDKHTTYDERIRAMLRKLNTEGYKLCVASNSIRDTVKMFLLRKGFIEFIDFFYSNQDVKNPKPNPEMYMRCMIKSEVSAKETLIIEDSHIGRKSAISSGANLCAVKNPDEVTYEKIKSHIEEIDKGEEIKPKWQGGKMNVLIPMAGAGTRFEKAGYTFPKPLIDVGGKPMIQVVVDNLNIEAKHIFLVQGKHYEKYNLKHMLNLISHECEVVLVDSLTEGAACTTLLAEQYIDNDEPLLLANSDQFVEWDSNEFMYSMIGDNVDAGMATFISTHPKWSFAKLDEEGFVCEVAEKKPISNIATVGIYFWRKGSDYVKYAKQMIEKNIRVNNEFYVCPIFNEAIQDDKKIKIFNIKKMWGLGSPEDLKTYLDGSK